MKKLLTIILLPIVSLQNAMLTCYPKKTTRFFTCYPSTKFLLIILVFALGILEGCASQMLVKYAAEGKISKVRNLIDKGADVNAKNCFHRTNFQCDSYDTVLTAAAARKGNSEIVRLLIDKGADVNIKNSRGATAVMFAALNGETETVKLLIDKGADQNAKDINGYTAWIYALLWRENETAKFLISKGADVPPGKAILVLPRGLIAEEFNNKKLFFNSNACDNRCKKHYERLGIDDPENLRIRNYAVINPGNNDLKISYYWRERDSLFGQEGQTITLGFAAVSGCIYAVRYKLDMITWSARIEEYAGLLKGLPKETPTNTLKNDDNSSHTPSLSTSLPSPSTTQPSSLLQTLESAESAGDERGIISITSDPPGAKVFIDGEFKGQTPAEISLKTGTYQIFIERQLYESYKDFLTIEKGQTKTLNIKLSSEGKEQK